MKLLFATEEILEKIKTEIKEKGFIFIKDADICNLIDDLNKMATDNKWICEINDNFECLTVIFDPVVLENKKNIFKINISLDK